MNEQEIMTAAHAVVLGTINARIRGNVADANLLLTGFHEDARKAGLAQSKAWSVLYTAATIGMAELITDRSMATNRNPAHIVQELAARRVMAAGSS